MITNHGAYSTEKPMDLKGLSTDTKPTGLYKGVNIPNGSTFLEMDTGKVYAYDDENVTWLEL
jgi:hypothetical protein